jgi:hypothetical protein
LRNSIATLEAQSIALEDNRTLLQIIITKPIVEQDQNSNLPTTTELIETSNDAKKIIDAIKAITK